MNLRNKTIKIINRKLKKIRIIIKTWEWSWTKIKRVRIRTNWKIEKNSKRRKIEIRRIKKNRRTKINNFYVR